MLVRKSLISAKKLNKLIKCFASDTTSTQAGELTDVSRTCADRYFRHFRELIYMATRRAPRFFGEVEMDQSEFGGRGHKRMKALLARYKKVLPYEEYQKKAKVIRMEHKVMVFGILQRGSDVYTHIIERADTDTLLPIVRLVVERDAHVFTPSDEKMRKNTIIYTDKWRAFTTLGLDGYLHKSINHSETYSDKQGTHINGIESFWSFAKRRIAKFNGIARTTLPLHIKECEWRYNQKDIEKSLRALLVNYQNPFPRHHADKGTSDHQSRQSPRTRVRIRRTPHTGSDSASSPRARPRVRVRPRVQVRRPHP